MNNLLLPLDMEPTSVEEELQLLAQLVEEAEALGIDLWPDPKPARPWAKYALASFMIIMILSWVSKVLFRFASV
jgi:hypothetical protein